MTSKCTKPIDWENSKNDLGIRVIINEMLSNQQSIIHKHIKKFLDTGGELTALAVSKHPDGTLVLRSDERTVVTVKMQVEGRKIGGAEFSVTT